MNRLLHYLLFLSFLLFSNLTIAQTTFYPGDIAMVGVSTDISACGFPAESDEFSFVCYRAFTTNTTIHITDNGWEVGNGGMWGDGEGTLSLTRTGGNVAAGTVITIRAINNSGTWAYSVVGLAVGWTIGQVNNPGGPFNLEPGGDQIYFLQGGTWDNQGGGGDDALYDGNVLFGFNTLPTWSANGTTNQSNIHPDLESCFQMTCPNVNYYKYTNPLNATNSWDWIKRMTNTANWTSSVDCAGYNALAPNYAGGYTFTINQLSLGVRCPTFCDKCAPAAFPVVFDLPPTGFFDVVYTNGTDLFYLYNIENWHYFIDTLYQSTTYSLVSVNEYQGCTLPPHFTSSANYTVPYNNPGTTVEIYVCADSEVPLPLNWFLGGAPGGTWYPGLSFDTYWYNDFGEGRWRYVFAYPDQGCPPDSASVGMHFANLDGTTYEITCDQNGTPNDIFDDFMTIELTVNGNNFGAEYLVYISEGTISPAGGMVGVPTIFTLQPGSAMGPDLILSIENINPPPEHLTLGPPCLLDIIIEATGFCSDPCDYDMEASIFGYGELCVNACPDESVFAEIYVNGGTPPYLMDFSVTADGFPVWNFTGISVIDFNEIEICIDTIAAPTFNPLTNYLIIPASIGGEEAEITLTSVTDFYGCFAILNGSAYVNLFPLPVLDSFDFTVCQEIAGTFDLTQYDQDIHLFYDVSWYDGNPLTVGNKIVTPTVTNLNDVVELWALVEDYNFCTNVIQVPYTILPSPLIDTIPPVEICAGTIIALQDIQIIDQGNSMATYTFHSAVPLDTSTLLDPVVFLPVDTVTIFLLASTGTCFDTMPIIINVQPYPDFTLMGTPCHLPSDTYSVYFTSSADSIYANAGTVINNLMGQDTILGIPDGVDIIIEIYNSTGLCSDTFTIVAPDCDCPTVNPPVASVGSYSVCDYDPIPIFSVSVDAGLSANWYNIPSGGVPLLQNSLTYQPASFTTATYYAEALNMADGCVSSRTPVALTVHPSAVLQDLVNPVLCDQQTINIDLLMPGVQNGVAGSGSWFALSTNQPVSGILQPLPGESWYYTFSSNPGMCLSYDTISAVVNPLPSLAVYEIVCDEINLTYAISFTSDAESVMSDVGTLTNVVGTDSFSITDVVYGVNIQISMANISTGCTSSFNQIAPDCSCPSLLQQSAIDICSEVANIDLVSYEGIGVSGSWELVTTPAGSNPATLTGSNFQGQNGDPGLYTLRFIRSVILDDCIDTAAFELTLHSSPLVDAGVDGTACAPDVILLSGTASGSNIQYSWQTTGSGTIANANALNTTYTPVLADFNLGTVSFTLSAIDQTGFCPMDAETITITIDASAYFILDNPTLTYCDTSDIVVDLDAYINYGTTAGSWFFPVGVTAPITNDSEFNPSTLMPGAYTVYYTTSNATLPCENDTAGINILIENCLCPSVALSNPMNALCSAASTQNLDDYLITQEPGTWSISTSPPGANPATINGSVFSTNQSDAGTYTIRYTLTNPMAGCPAFAEINLVVIATPSIQVVSTICSADLMTWQATIVSAAQLVANSTGTITLVSANTYLISNLTLGSGLQINASNGSGLCLSTLNIPSPDCDCDLAVSNLPDVVMLCPGDMMSFDAVVTGGSGTVTSFWVHANDTLDQTNINVDEAGVYVFISFDSLGCRQEHNLEAIIYQEMIADIGNTPITCPGDNDGSIVLFDIQGGNGPFFISINNGTLQPINAFPHIIGNLGQGTYAISIEDGFGCMISSTQQVLPTNAETVNLGPDETILIGDSIVISPLLSFIPESFYWTGDTSLINTSLLINTLFPLENFSLTLFALDINGCIYSDDLTVKVLLSSSIFVPNVFSPNNDGVNDVVAPLADPSIVSIEIFEIFSRWGEKVFSAKGFVPNADEGNWDGRFKEELLNPGVFVYRLSATNKKGHVLNINGNITLIK